MSTSLISANDYLNKYQNQFDPYRVPTYIIWKYKNTEDKIIETKSMLINTMSDNDILNSLNYFSNSDGFIGFVDTPPFTD